MLKKEENVFLFIHILRNCLSIFNFLTSNKSSIFTKIIKIKPRIFTQGFEKNEEINRFSSNYNVLN